MSDMDIAVNESSHGWMLRDSIAKLDLMDADIDQRLSLTEDDFD